MGAQPYGTIPSARRTWERIARPGDLEWLENPTFISSDCFRAPAQNTQPRAWDRIAVPAAATRRSCQKIHKRISTRRVVDPKYCAVVAELESQSLDARKRARMEEYIVPYGSVEFKDELRPDVVGEQDLDEAREHVEGALQDIWRDNLRLREDACHQKSKRCSFDPAQLTWVPRKRHNTRWPVNPPTEAAEFIAKLQPLIKFELHPSQIDEAVTFAQEDSVMQNGIKDNGVPPSPRVPEPQEPAHKSKREKPTHRRRTLRPSLSTISEATDETPIVPFLTPGSARSVYVSPAKRWQATAGTAKTPTKIAESFMKDFTMCATPKAGHVKITNQSDQTTVPLSPADPESATSHVPVFHDAGRLRVPSPRNTESTIHHTPVFNHAGYFNTLSTLDTESTISHAPGSNDEGHPDASSRTHTSAESSNIYVTALPFFDQPIPEVHIEPEHESRRRFSLDNARRSDRTSNVRIIKRVYNWMASASVGKKRRYSDVGAMSTEHQEPKRRHTLDVDAGMNPDIFGQLQALPAPVETRTKPVEISHKAVEDLQRRVANIPAVSAEVTAPQPENPLAHDEDVATVEAGESEGNIESEETEGHVESEDGEENVEGDSDMAYLQSFVQRSKSSKEGKRDDVPSAPILPGISSKKRRSGSMSLATSDAGSPKAKMTTNTTTTTASPRVPLGEKDANKSPSPNKKRKLKGLEEELTMPIKKRSGRLVAPDLDDLEPTANKRRKRRKGMESDTDDIFNPNMDLNQVLTQRSGAGSRRSTRIATVQKAEPPAIPVRLPGSTMGLFADIGDMPTVSTAGITNAVFQRKVDKDLASETKANTRKNRGGAVPVPIALASMADRSGDGDEHTAKVSVEPEVGRSSGGKTVRWDEVLARVQGEELVAACPAEKDDKVDPDTAPAPEIGEDEDEEEDAQLPSPPQLRAVEPAPDRPGNPVGSQLSLNDEGEEELPAKKPESTPVRRSSRAATASRLPKRGGAVVIVPAAVPPTPLPAPVVTPKRRSSLLPAPSRISKSDGRGGAAVASAGAAETRARLGMAGPGTPAPRRGGRRGGRRG